jgi:hypothetical protein
MAKAPTDIRSLARSHTETAIRVLAGIMREPDAPAAARVSAAQALLDRGWGKPDQTVTNDVTDNFLRMLDLISARTAGAVADSLASEPRQPAHLC